MTGFLASLFRRPVANQLPLNDAGPWRELGIIGSSASGVNVTPSNAMTYSAVLACVRVLAETLASLPLITYERQGERKERARDFYLYRLLHDQPNPQLTSFEFRELLMVHLLMWGNGYCEIEVNGLGQAMALWPLLPWMMREIKLQDGELVYKYEMPNGRMETIPGWRVWHLRGLSLNGIVGYAIDALAQDSIGLGMAAEKFGAKFFSNGATMGGMLEHPGVLGDTAHENLRASINEAHGGLDRAHRLMILEEGMKYQATGVPPEAAQFLETRKFQRSEIAGILRVPPHMIADLEHATFSNIEHQAIAFVVHTMRPWFVRWEQSIHMHLMSRAEQERFYVEFLADALLRGDLLSRYQAYAIARQWGWFNADDIRQLENMNPLPDGQGQIYLTPLNMVPADQAGQEQAATINEPSAHYRLLAEEAAGRVVRKEVAALTKAAGKYAAVADWEAAVDDFFADHAEFVAQTMRIPLETAARYTAVNRQCWLYGNVSGDWQTRRVAALAGLAMGEIT